MTVFKGKTTKILVCTSRIRPDGQQTVFPPLGSMSIIQELIKHGYDDTYLYDIDGMRPSIEEVAAHFRRQHPAPTGEPSESTGDQTDGAARPVQPSLPTRRQ